MVVVVVVVVGAVCAYTADKYSKIAKTIEIDGNDIGTVEGKKTIEHKKTIETTNLFDAISLLCLRKWYAIGLDPFSF